MQVDVVGSGMEPIELEDYESWDWLIKTGKTSGRQWQVQNTHVYVVVIHRFLGGMGRTAPWPTIPSLNNKTSPSHFS